jgi:hypothetical protein
VLLMESAEDCLRQVITEARALTSLPFIFIVTDLIKYLLLK